MIPVEESAEFFGFYSVFEKFFGYMGPFVFGIIRQITGTIPTSHIVTGWFLYYWNCTFVLCKR
jgi:UMF1 family MFS transporter